MQPKCDNPSDYEMEEYKAWRRRVFWTRVSKEPGLGPQGDCWEWIAGGTRAGYGTMYFAGRNHYVHRISWFIFHGLWPTLHVCHRCDNPPCVNPDHLFEGDDSVNIADAIAKGRARQMIDGPGLRGETHGMVKLTSQEVMEIRRRYAMREKVQVLMQKYHVTESCIRMIVCGESWAHLPLIKRPNSIMKLLPEQVLAIRASSLSAPELAKQYGVHRQTIYKVKSGRPYGDEATQILEGKCLNQISQ